MSDRVATVTPSWEWAFHMCHFIIENGATDSAKETAWGELHRMSLLADKYVARKASTKLFTNGEGGQ